MQAVGSEKSEPELKVFASCSQGLETICLLTVCFVTHFLLHFTKVPVSNGLGVKERKLFSWEQACLRRGSVPAIDSSQVGCGPPTPALCPLEAGTVEGLHLLNRQVSSMGGPDTRIRQSLAPG